MSKKNEMKYEEAMIKLTGIVETLEDGNLPLDKALEEYKDGVELAIHINNLLSTAEGKITILTKDLENKLKEEKFLVE